MKSDNAARAMQKLGWQEQIKGKTKEEISQMMKERRAKGKQKHEQVNP